MLDQQLHSGYLRQCGNRPLTKRLPAEFAGVSLENNDDFGDIS
jgi:hypothetical protein